MDDYKHPPKSEEGPSRFMREHGILCNSALWSYNESQRQVIDDAGLSYRVVNGGTTLLFRERLMPKADFYPGRDRWKVGCKVTEGTAVAFVEWWIRMRKERDEAAERGGGV
jgi:hypothetical protein